MNRGDVYWVTLSSEGRGKHIQEGRRPCVIISNDKNNESSDVIQILPFTTKADMLPIHKKVIFNHHANYCMPEQIVSINKSYIERYICTLDDYQMLAVEQAILLQLGF